MFLISETFLIHLIAQNVDLTTFMQLKAKATYSNAVAVDLDGESSANFSIASPMMEWM